MMLTKNNSINQANCITRRLKTAPRSTMNLLNNMLFILCSLRSSQNRKVPLNEKGKKKNVGDFLSMMLVTISLSANLWGSIRENFLHNTVSSFP